MQAKDMKKSERARAAAAAAGVLADFKAQAAQAEAEVAAARDPYGSIERNQRAERDVRARWQAKLWPQLGELAKQAEAAKAAAPLWERSSYLRREALKAEPGAVAAMLAMSEPALAALIADSAGMGDVVTVAVGLNLGRRFTNPSLLSQVRDAAGSLELQECDEVNAQLETIRKAYLEAQLTVQRVVDPLAGAKTLELGHAMAEE